VTPSPNAFEIDGEFATRVDDFFDHGAALRAAGLSE